ncbi:uncharacterized protein LOC134279180 isoform X1 [Saccostrea cucullata]|uniref:uncharacterized protein LOC134279180 isoform X1 n=1 Tax=Saccostrea cuccullata TaxID=36930 RepID=UPI002ED2F1C3
MMEKLGSKTMEQRLRTSLLQYLSRTNTRTMTPVRQHILEILIFLYGKETASKDGGFSFSNRKDIAEEQKKYIVFAYLFMEALKKNMITETDLRTLQRMWTQHILYLTKSGKDKAAERYLRILEDSEEVIFNIKRFQNQLIKTKDFLAKNTTDPAKTRQLDQTFQFRRSGLFERIGTRLRKFFGQRDPDDFFMAKFQDVN